MPKKCSVLGCTTNRDCYEPGLRFFHIPREDEVLQERWLQLIGRDPDWKIPNIPTVCEKHFTPEQVSVGRNLAPDVIPTLNLPGPTNDNPNSNDDPPLTESTVKRTQVPRKKRVSKRRRIEEPELVLVEPQGVLTFELCCRLCSLELKVTEGLKIADARSSQLVWKSIWDVCLLQSDSTEIYGAKICGDCWSKMQEFSYFVQTCHQQQKRLLPQSPDCINSLQDESDEQSDSEMKNEQVPREIDKKGENVFEEQNSDLPPLEGLSIDEMLEALDKVVVKAPRRSKHDGVSIDEECWDCGKMFANRSQRKEHRKICSAIGTAESLRNRSYTCDICSKPFNSRHGYRTHLQRMHKNDPTQEKNTSEELKRLQSKKRLQCPLCPDRFQQLHQLKYHLKTHKIKSLSTTKPRRINRQNENSNSCYCELCDKTFQNPSYLSLHMKFHKRERDFQCDQCEKQFFIKSDLKNHKMTVHEAHSFLCGICGKTYGARRYFNRHMLRHNSDPSQKPYKCSYCTDSFYTASDLKYHVTRHTGEKMHGCEICGQAFRFRHLLTHHKKNKHGMQLDGLMLAKVDEYYGESEEVLNEQVLNEDDNVANLECFSEVVISEEIA
ncbi:zinc finger protein 624-like [Ochlerotatus camptorhynchus]|uniref:zinc finger protein 624-like n=1 Tax=Ochlerotatus camptorhynchus TaxID=644619 RepID=UPI0031CFC2C3